jgi:hypothetical protein
MAVPIHKTGLWKTLGQKSSAIVSTNLIGNFDPSLGIASSSWTNQAASNALRRYNGITYNSSSPKNFEFDGTNDYLGEASSGYGGTAFTMPFKDAYTFGQWMFIPNSFGGGSHHYILELKDSSINHITVEISSDTMRVRSRTGSGNADPVSFAPNYNFILGKNKWIYATVTHDGSGGYKMYLNGKFIGVVNASYAPSGGPNVPLKVGRYNNSYSAAGVKVGHIHVYSSELTTSQIRQNFLASYSINNTRLYGDVTMYTD